MERLPNIERNREEQKDRERQERERERGERNGEQPRIKTLTDKRKQERQIKNVAALNVKYSFQTG